MKVGSSRTGGPPEGRHAVDQHVGLRIRIRREELGISQEAVAKALGISFQQVQKYERATNRVSASRLFEIARVLNIAPTYFFDGAVAGSAPSSAVSTTAFLTSHEGAELAKTFPNLPTPVRRHVLGLVRALAEAGCDVGMGTPEDGAKPR